LVILFWGLRLVVYALTRGEDGVGVGVVVPLFYDLNAVPLVVQSLARVKRLEVL